MIHAAPAEHRISSIPGYPKLLSATFGGYIQTPVADDKTKNYSSYYIFFEKENMTKEEAATNSTPLLLVLEGGPGCSSSYDALSSSGPYFFRHGTFVRNLWSWNRLGGVLYVDSPPGVGWSINKANPTQNWTDAAASLVNYNVLNRFFELYPEHNNRPLLLAGISYCGHYIPQLAHRILRGGGRRLQQLEKRGGGIFLGSPCLGTGFRTGKLADLDWCFTTNNGSTPGETTDPTLTPFFQGQGFMPVDALIGLGLETVPNPHDVLDPPWSGHIVGFDNLWVTATSCQLPDGDAPEDKKREAAEMATAGPNSILLSQEQRQKQQQPSRFNSYSRFRSWRKHSSNDVAASSSSSKRSAHVQEELTTTWELPQAPYDACASELLARNFLNEKPVKEAMHASAETTWQDCRGTSDGFFYPSENRGVKSELFDLMNETSVPILIYSGTADSDVNPFQTQEVIASFGRPLKSNYTVWYYPLMQSHFDKKQQKQVRLMSYQIGGSFFKMDRISYSSVKGSGHMASGQTPRPVFSLLESFIRQQGTPGLPVAEQTMAVRIAHEAHVELVASSSAPGEGRSFEVGVFFAGFLTAAFISAVAGLVMYRRFTKNQPAQPAAAREDTALLSDAAHGAGPTRQAEDTGRRGYGTTGVAGGRASRQAIYGAEEHVPAHSV